MEGEKELWPISGYYGRIRYEELMKAAKSHMGSLRFNPGSLQVYVFGTETQHLRRQRN
jgi:hypothetical protein